MSLKIAVLLVGIATSAHGQEFQNLNFEAAIVPAGTQIGGMIPVSDGLTGWAAYFTTDGVTTPQTQITYDGIGTGGGMISIVDSQVATPLQGSYSAYLYSGGTGFGPTIETASISQTGAIPSGTESLVFDAYSLVTPIVAIDGQSLSLVPLEAISFYTLYGAAIPPADVGPSVTLSFTEPEANLELDNIVFSQTALSPEPKPLILTGIGGLIFALHRRFRQQ
jgi:hypothetical protein